MIENWFQNHLSNYSKLSIVHQGSWFNQVKLSLLGWPSASIFLINRITYIVKVCLSIEVVDMLLRSPVPSYSGRLLNFTPFSSDSVKMAIVNGLYLGGRIIRPKTGSIMEGELWNIMLEEQQLDELP